MRKPKVSLILPCFNEAEHFTLSAEEILRVLKKNKFSFEIIFVEDCSVDNTKELIKNFIKKHSDKQLKAIFHTKNQGRGKAVSDGIKKAHGDIVGFIDIDLEVSPNYIPAFVKAIEQGSDVACAVRSYTFSFTGLLRGFASKLYSFLVRVILHVSLQDTEAGYKFFNKSKILSILQKTKSTHWFWDTEVMVLSDLHGLKIKEIPVIFVRQTDKTSTVNLIPDTRDYLKNLYSFRKRLKRESVDENMIDTYWKKTPSLFSKAYFTVSPTNFFLKKRFKKIIPYFKDISGKKVLDVGCGNGVFMKEIIKNGGFAVGIDYSKDMIEQARKNLQEFDGQFKLIKTDARKLPFKDSSFDIVLASGLTDYLSKADNMKFLHEAKRVLKSNGIVIITFPKKKSPFSFLRSGFGLGLRRTFLHLPPMLSSFSEDEIERAFKQSSLQTKYFDSVFSTMWIVVGEKQ